MLELIIVLSILAVLTTVAVQSLEPVGKQSRVDATQKTLAELRAAIVGRETTTDDSQVSNPCFVSDMGRFPTSIDELFVNIHNVTEFHSSALAGDHSDVTVSRGWRGPYMRLPAGATTLRDGWGNFFGFDLTDGLKVTSFGSDALSDSVGAPVDTYGVDTGFSLTTTASVDSYYGHSISGNVLELVGGQWVAPTAATEDQLEIEVTLFTPHPSVPTNADGVLQTVQSPAAPSYRYSFCHPTSNLTIGPRVVKATLKRTTTTTTPDMGSGSTTTTTTVDKKGVANVIVRPGATYLVDLRVQ